MRTMIDDTATMFTLINTFETLPHKQGAVVKSLRSFTEQHAVFCKGFIGAAVHASADGQRVINYVQWEARTTSGT